VRLLLFSDLHADVPAAERLLEASRSADILVGAGDFGRMRREVVACIPALRASGKPAVFVAGNGESADELRVACRDWGDAVVLHGTRTTVGGVSFFGIGGAIPPTPFGDWSWDHSEAEAETLLSALSRDAVVISHSPPRGVGDVNGAGEHVGSEAVRAAILRASPRLVVCGHIHTSWGAKERLGRSWVINAGPHGVLWDLEEQSAT
jgi:Icc-related predicted phosphoesterase